MRCQDQQWHALNLPCNIVSCLAEDAKDMRVNAQNGPLSRVDLRDKHPIADRDRSQNQLYAQKQDCVWAALALGVVDRDAEEEPDVRDNPKHGHELIRELQATTPGPLAPTAGDGALVPRFRQQLR